MTAHMLKLLVCRDSNRPSIPTHINTSGCEQLKYYAEELADEEAGVASTWEKKTTWSHGCAYSSSATETTLAEAMAYFKMLILHKDKLKSGIQTLLSSCQIRRRLWMRQCKRKLLKREAKARQVWMVFLLQRSDANDGQCTVCYSYIVMWFKPEY